MTTPVLPQTRPPAPAGGAPPCRVSAHTLVQAFADGAAAAPDRTALTADGESLSYRRLDAWSGAVRDLLRGHGIGRGDRVALRLPPGAAAIAAILGVLRSGAAYVPLDIRNPEARNALILEDAQVAAFLGDPAGEPHDDVLNVGSDQIAALRETPPPPPAAPVPVPHPEDTAYIIYTSGTTGRPKGVPIHHGAATALLSGATRRFSLSGDDVWVLFHSLAFDVAVWEMWGALATGGRLVVLPHWATRSPDECLRTVREERVTVLGQTPTAFATFADAALRADADLPDLRYVVFAGEKLVPDTLRAWTDRYGLRSPVLVNMYGITETTVHSTYHEVTEADLADGASVVGHPLPGFSHRVVTADGEEARPGEQGVLWLAGPQVSKGYLNREALNAERFALLVSPEDGRERRYYRSGDLVSRRADGALVYHGREDHQVKLRGHRIELSDIEAAVRAHPRVADAVVWVRGFGPGDDRLVCAYTASDGDEVPAKELRSRLKGSLPSYMWPAGYRLLPHMPRTVNGKLDRDAVSRLWEQRGNRR
ncbi:amino acid adenylation domain-containing protein [Nocardiopsis halophila]|uniref:amino acid adenylation domain-containing protein n=1 Tax=Nocardiopsis halophila TaxID=141692 RepID=UPI0003453969|nr:amino acid adenylation domain-containing protein [Nocardiopsis halophila]